MSQSASICFQVASCIQNGTSQSALTWINLGNKTMDELVKKQVVQP